MTEVSETSARPWWRRGGVVVIAGMLAAVVLGFLVGRVLRDDDNNRVTLPFPESQRPLGPGGQALAQLLTDVRDKTFHVKYKATGGEGVQSLEWWNRPGRARQDTVLEADNQRVQTASFLERTSAHTCIREGNGEWKCEEVPVPETTTPTGLIEALAAQLSGRSVTEHKDTVGGRAAWCFAVAKTAAQDAVEVCTDRDGVPLRIVAAGAGFEVETIERRFDNKIFTRPA